MTEAPLTDPRYTVPPDGNAPYSSGGWSPELAYSTTGTPDPIRVGQLPEIDFYANPSDSESFHEERSQDTSERESEVQKSTLPFATHTTADSGARFAPNPRATPPAESRWTGRLSPVTSFIRNMLGGSPKHFDGVHMSMADHVRTYEIHGMAPQRSSRSTYRLEAPDYGLSVVDLPPDPGQPVSGTIRGLNVPRSTGAFRL